MYADVTCMLFFREKEVKSNITFFISFVWLVALSPTVKIHSDTANRPVSFLPSKNVVLDDVQ